MCTSLQSSTRLRFAPRLQEAFALKCTPAFTNTEARQPQGGQSIIGKFYFHRKFKSRRLGSERDAEEFFNK